jgi:iron(III) transport system substrate-binding protein
VVVYTSVDRVFAEPILERFEARSGTRTLALYDVEATKTTGLVNRLISEAGAPRADVFWNGEFAQTLVLRQRGVLAPYRSPAASGLPGQYVEAAGYWTGLGGRARVLLVNTSLVPEDRVPNGLSDLLSERWPPGQIAVAHPLFGTTAAHVAALYATQGADRARQFLAALRARGVRLVDGNSVVRDLVASGQAMAGLTDSDDACGAIERGAPVRLVFPDQDEGGTLVIPGTVALIAGGPHPAEGRRLIDYLLGPEADGQLVESGFSQMSLRDPGLRSACVALDSVRAMRVSYADIGGLMPRVQTELREIFVR